jgi:hypothetical protein
MPEAADCAVETSKKVLAQLSSEKVAVGPNEMTDCLPKISTVAL